MKKPGLLVEVSRNVAWITFNRPEVLNALNGDIVDGITETLANIAEDRSIRGVVIKGAGRSFSAGGDIQAMSQVTPNLVHDYVGQLNQAVLAMKRLAVPIVAQVHGFCVGAGFNLALACDLIVAADTAQFMMSFVQVGLISDGGGMYFLPRLVGTHKAKELLFLGDPISAMTARELGIVNRMVPEPDLQKEVEQLMDRFVRGPGLAIGQMKLLADKAMVSSLEEMLLVEQTTQPKMVASADHQEGVRAFLEKRPPRFQGQ